MRYKKNRVFPGFFVEVTIFQTMLSVAVIWRLFIIFFLIPFIIVGLFYSFEDDFSVIDFICQI